MEVGGAVTYTAAQDDNSVAICHWVLGFPWGIATTYYDDARPMRSNVSKRISASSWWEV